MEAATVAAANTTTNTSNTKKNAFSNELDQDEIAPKQTNRKRRELPKKAIKLGKTVEAYELRRMPIVIRSKFSFYLEQPNIIVEAQKDSKNRLKALYEKQLIERKKILEKMQEASAFDLSKKSSKNLKQAIEEAEAYAKYEKERHERLIGQLKAAEAANRSRILKLRYYNMKKDEIENLIESQSTALDAVRLEAFLPPVKEKKLVEKSSLNQIQKRRLEAMIDDPQNAFIQRKLD